MATAKHLRRAEPRVEPRLEQLVEPRRAPLRNLMQVLAFCANGNASKRTTAMLLALAKVERHDRSLRDWMRLVESFEAANAAHSEEKARAFTRRHDPDRKC